MKRITGKAVYGKMPDRSKALFIGALGKEEPKMKRVSGIVLVFALLLALAGVAIAAHQIGTFDFLFPDKNIPEALVDQRQTGFSQEGEGMETVDITVQDAVSDGISIFMAVEFTAKNPDDILLSEYAPDADWYKGYEEDGRRRLVVWQDFTLGNGLYLAGQDWQAPDQQTVIVHYVIDILDVELAGDELRVAFSPGINVMSPDGTQEHLERTNMEVGIQVAEMEQTRRYSVSPIQHEQLSITFDEIELICTPVATYLRATFSGDDVQDELAFYAWANEIGSLNFDLHDGADKAYNPLVSQRMYDTIGETVFQMTVLQIYEAMDENTTMVTLTPYRYEPFETLDSFDVQLQERASK